MIRFEVVAVACAFGLFVGCSHDKPASDPSTAATPDTSAPTSEESISPGVTNGMPSASGSELGGGSTNPQTTTGTTTPPSSK